MYRIISRYPCYCGCIPVTGYFVQRLQEGFLFDRWVDIKGFGSYKEAKQLLDLLNR